MHIELITKPRLLMAAAAVAVFILARKPVHGRDGKLTGINVAVGGRPH